MIVPLTLRLIAVPELGWPRLSAACDRNEPLPTPLIHAVTVSAAATVASVIGSLVSPERTFVAGVVAVVVTAMVYSGAAIGTVLWAPRLIRPALRLQGYTARFASCAILPALASGVAYTIPLDALSVVAALAGVLMTYWSARIGALDLLGLEGAPRKQAALVVTLFAGAPIVSGALIVSLL